MKILLIGLAVASLAGCATHPAGGAVTERRVSYTCEGGPDLTVVYAENVARVVQPDGSTVELPAQVTGSGFAYGTPMHTLRGKGEELTYTVGRMVPRQCREK
ncbi:MliC family protein [Stenotrophomonas sp. Iso1]|uniref:MliC family protein n=1 Tax=Stenotrophomonas sp. Iso1 TaxID=2977283 RepID=UPI0022B76ED0|nr:MliC family protein [Stenotrophomonas sp. Iso1]